MSKRRSKRQLEQDNQFLQEMIDHNQGAIQEGPKKKKWTKHDMIHVRPKTENQQLVWNNYMDGEKGIFLKGSAGTGKTFLSLALACCSVLNSEQPQTQIIIVRSVVPSREIGFLPGTQEEKTAPYEQPYKDILAGLFKKPTTYDDMKTAGLINFVPTSFVRGLTWDNAVIIIDEVQNMNDMEINSVMTRIGANSRLLVCGDINQNDLVNTKKEVTGIHNLVKCFNHMKSPIITFNIDDIVRSGFVREWIIARQELGMDA